MTSVSVCFVFFSDIRETSGVSNLWFSCNMTACALLLTSRKKNEMLVMKQPFTAAVL